MHSPSLRQPRARRGKPAPVPAALPAHLNFSFPDWYRQRTELPRQASGWTPLSRLYSDYLEWCQANDVPGVYVHTEAELSGMLRARCDRAPENRPVKRIGAGGTVVSSGNELCFPRHLIPAVKVYS